MFVAVVVLIGVLSVKYIFVTNIGKKEPAATPVNNALVPLSISTSTLPAPPTYKQAPLFKTCTT